METTRLSTKGQIILPKALRDAHAWAPGTEFIVEETPDGVVLRPTKRFPETRLDDVAGSLSWRGRSKTTGQMRAAVAREATRRQNRGRY
jgi:AbrB family looped-hinge helix DNA binding protein